jgi:3-hydroxyacyl-CoA dehydrogenase/enoyl-CoA hydratase/3-hydroxybutyryl-CoA epimerase
MPPFETLTRTRGDDAIDWISFRVPGHRLNVLTPQAVADLAAVLDEIDAEAAAGAPPRAIVLTADAGCGFFAGADLDRLGGLLAAAATDRGSALEATTAGRTVFNRLSSRPWASVAVVDGVCLGGGLELALACDLRLAVDGPQTSFGAPEVKLGLIPGWGGTVRLPRLIGPGPTMEFAGSGESSNGRHRRNGFCGTWVSRGDRHGLDPQSDGGASPGSPETARNRARRLRSASG